MNELNEVIAKLLARDLSEDLNIRIKNLANSLTDDNLEEIFAELMKILNEIDQENKNNGRNFLSNTGSLLLTIGVCSQYICPEFIRLNLWYGLLGLSFLSLSIII